MRTKDLVNLEEAYTSIYENMHDLAKQDPREAYPHKDDMEEFEKETEGDLYRDETKEEEENKTDDKCSCDGENKEECNCD
jgi:hypothetical protein